MIVLTGATGNTGRLIADALLERGVAFVAMARSERRREELRARGISAVHGDFDDPPSLAPALEGAEKAYLVCTPDEHLVRRETAFVEAAREAGVRHLVKCSAYMAAVDAESQNLRSHGVIEEAIRGSGMDFTVLRPHGFMQTFTLMGWDMLQKSGVISFPAGDGGLPLVDVRDVAAVAVKALTEPGHEGRVYDLTGPAVLTFWEQARVLGRVLERPIHYLPGSDAALDLVMRLMGTTETPRDHVRVVSKMIREHRFDRVHPDLEELGISPTTYEEFLRDLVAGRTGGGNSFQPPDTLLLRAVGTVMPALMRWRIRLAGAPKAPPEA